jgi:competence ComEA-like helix-hairpin-helix protein
MSSFRPVDVKIIVALSTLVLIGSVMTLLKRQRVISSLDLGIFIENSPYKQSYRSSDFTAENDSGSSAGDSLIRSESAGKAISERIDLNRAGFYDLQSLPGIGPVIAERILAYRDSVEGFGAVEDLLKIRGIGPVKLKKFKDRVTIK